MQQQVTTSSLAPQNLTTHRYITLSLKYTDADSYKTFFDLQIDSEQFPEVLNVSKGNELTMGEFGTPSEEEFFNSEVHPYPYNHSWDHNILEVVSISTK